MREALTFASADVAAELRRWLAHLSAERRMSGKTVDAYERDARQFLAFLAGHLGKPPSLKSLGAIEPRDVRAFMAARRGEGIGSRSLMRALAGVRSFARFLEHNGKGKVGALAAVRAPKMPKTLPKPLSVASAKRLTETALRAGEEREPWVLARDAAILALLYGSGLRISEALGLAREGVPALGEGDSITVIGKGNKTRMVPVLPQVLKLIAEYVALCPYDLPQESALFRGARGGPLSPAHCAAHHGAAARGAWPCRDGHAACAAPFVRHAPARARRRPARHPGIARPRLALDHADLHRGRQRAAVAGLPQRPPARVMFR